MDLNQILGPLRPFLQLAGTFLIIAGLAKFFGIDIPVSHSGLEIAVAGFLAKSI